MEKPNGVKKKLPIFILIFFAVAILPELSAYSTYLDNSTLNTSISNTSVSLFDLSIDLIEYGSQEILLTNISYNSSGKIWNITSSANFSIKNHHIDSSEFPFIGSQNDDTSNIFSNLTDVVNATIVFIPPSCNIRKISYSSASGNYTKNYHFPSCIDGAFHLDLIGIEGNTTQNTLTFTPYDAPASQGGSTGSSGEEAEEEIEEEAGLFDNFIENRSFVDDLTFGFKNESAPENLTPEQRFELKKRQLIAWIIAIAIILFLSWVWNRNKKGNGVKRK